MSVQRNATKIQNLITFYRAGGMAEVECLPNEHESLSSVLPKRKKKVRFCHAIAVDPWYR
jgi:hypothetical protein